MDEKLKLSDYLILAAKFNEDPTEENSQALEDFLDKLVVREYIPLKEKDILMVQVLRKITKDFDAAGAASFLEMGKIETGLFAYCVNLELDTGVLSGTYTSYDLYFQHGLVDSILLVCEDDYKRLCTMIDNAIQFSNIYRLIESAQLLDSTEYDKWIETMNDIKDTINSDTIKDIIGVVAQPDEKTKSLMDMLNEEALREIQEEYNSDHNKFQAAIRALSKKDTEDQEDAEYEDSEEA